jgi:photosystem II stability/assembly factor-like uncharacterized protein
MKSFLSLAVLMSAGTVVAQPHNWHGCALAPNGRDAWIVAIDTAIVFHSPDAGNTWEEQEILTQRTFFDVFFLDESNGWTGGLIADAWHTSDGGVNWQRQGQGASKFFTRVFFVDPTHGWAAAGSAIMGRWDEGFQTWEQIILPNPPFSADTCDFYGVVFIDTLKGWICAGRFPEDETLFWGGQGYIATSEDGGRNWTLQQRDTEHDLFDIDFVDYEHGWVVGGRDSTLRGYAARTTDGGQTWSGQELPEYGMLRAVDFVDPLHGWAVGRVGTIIHTTDGGQIWLPQASGVDSTLFDVEFVDPLIGMASGLDAVLFTDDGGSTWRRSVVGAVAEPGRRDRRDGPDGLQVTLSLTATGAAIQYELARDAHVDLSVFDSQGRRVRTVESGLRSGGRYRAAWDGRDAQGRPVSAGVHFVLLAGPDWALSRKVIPLRE